MLPFKVANKAIRVEGIPGVEGPVWLRPWSLGFYESEVVPRVLGDRKPKNEAESVAMGRWLIAASVAKDESGEPAFFSAIPGVEGRERVLDPDHPAILELPSALFKGLTAAIWDHCGPRGLEAEKNDSTPTPSSG